MLLTSANVAHHILRSGLPANWTAASNLTFTKYYVVPMPFWISSYQAQYGLIIPYINCILYELTLRTASWERDIKYFVWNFPIWPTMANISRDYSHVIIPGSLIAG